MTHNDWYLALLALACALFAWAAIARKQPEAVALVPLGLAVVTLAWILRAAGVL